MSGRLSRLVWPLAAFMLLLLPSRASAQEAVEYYGVDGVGSVRAVFSASGTLLSRVDYGPFGEQIATSTLVPKAYAQLFRDGEAGQDYAQARMYQARTGRLTGPDTVFANTSNPQRLNRYTYALNRPLNVIDPTGLVADCPDKRPGHFCTETEEEGDSPPDIRNGADRDDGSDDGGVGGPPQNPPAPTPNPSPTPTPTPPTPPVPPVPPAPPTGPKAPTPPPLKCTGPSPGCRPVSLHPGQMPFYVTDAEWNEIARNQAAGLAFVAGWELGGYLPSVSGYASELSAYLFARHGVGKLNQGDYFRIGVSWEGSAQAGREVFRVAIGSKRSSIHLHWTLWPLW